MMAKTNRNLVFEKDKEKTYVYIKDGKSDVGMLLWDFKKKCWVLERPRKKR